MLSRPSGRCWVPAFTPKAEGAGGPGARLDVAPARGPQKGSQLLGVEPHSLDGTMHW